MIFSAILSILNQAKSQVESQSSTNAPLDSAAQVQQNQTQDLDDFYGTKSESIESDDKDQIIDTYQIVLQTNNLTEYLYEVRQNLWLYMYQNITQQQKPITRYMASILLMLELLQYITLSLAEKNILIKICDRNSGVKTLGLGQIDMVLFQMGIEKKTESIKEGILYRDLLIILIVLQYHDTDLYGAIRTNLIRFGFAQNIVDLCFIDLAIAFQLLTGGSISKLCQIQRTYHNKSNYHEINMHLYKNHCSEEYMDNLLRASQ